VVEPANNSGWAQEISEIVFSQKGEAETAQPRQTVLDAYHDRVALDHLGCLVFRAST
jgi:hypothetical protein